MSTPQRTGRQQAVVADQALQELLGMLGSDHGRSVDFHVDAQTESSLWAASTSLKWALGGTVPDGGLASDPPQEGSCLHDLEMGHEPGPDNTNTTENL